MDKKVVFRKNSGSTLSRKVKILYNKLGNTNTKSKHIVNSKRLQNTIFKVSSTTEKVNGDLLFTKKTASDSGRNSGNVEKRCTSQNNTKTQQQPGVLQQFVFSKEVEWRKPSCDQSKRSEWFYYLQLQPSQQLEFLGLIIDTSQMAISLTEEKIQKVIKNCQELYQSSQSTPLKLTKLIGLLSSAAQAILPARIQYKYLQ